MIRRELAELRHNDTQLSQECQDKVKAATTETEKQDIWKSSSIRLSRNSTEFMQAITGTYQVDAMLLRDELLKRLPVGSKAPARCATGFTNFRQIRWAWKKWQRVSNGLRSYCELFIQSQRQPLPCHNQRMFFLAEFLTENNCGLKCGVTQEART